MNYIELINNFWKLDEHWQFTCCETRLYFYLVKTANGLGWVDSWTHSDAKTSANVGVSVNSFKTARNRLMQAGLISFKEGGKGQGIKCRYQILTPKQQPKAKPKPQPKAEANLDANDDYTLYRNINVNETTPPPQVEMTPEYEKFLVFEKWIADNAPSVAVLKEPFTFEQYKAIRSEHSNEFIKSLLLDMHNWKDLAKKRTSAHLTFKQWAKKN